MHTTKMLATVVTDLFITEFNDELHLICSDIEYAGFIGYEPFFLWQGKLDKTAKYKTINKHYIVPKLPELIGDNYKDAPEHLIEQIKGE